MAIYKSGKKVDLIYINGKKEDAIYKNGIKIYNASNLPKIVTFRDGTDEEIIAMLDAHYNGLINIADYWHLGDTRVMHLTAVNDLGFGTDHVSQDMAMIIIGIEHDTLKEPINGKQKAAITLQCKEVLGNKGKAEEGESYGGLTPWANSQRRTWLNSEFLKALPSIFQPLVKTVIKKNLANPDTSTPGISTDDKMFFPSYPEMFGNVSYSGYNGNPTLEGEQYPYYNSDNRRIKYANNDGIAGSSASGYILRSPYSFDKSYTVAVDSNGMANVVNSGYPWGLAPAFCL